jgi:hypothetical protein
MGWKSIAPAEKDVLYTCLEWLNLLPGCRAWRQNTGGMTKPYTSKKTGKTKLYVVKFGHKGMADISGWIGPYCTRLEIEAKAPGGVPTADQAEWITEVRNAHGIAFACDSLASCIASMKEVYKQKGWQWNTTWECDWVVGARYDPGQDLIYR